MSVIRLLAQMIHSNRPRPRISGSGLRRAAGVGLGGGAGGLGGAGCSALGRPSRPTVPGHYKDALLWGVSRDPRFRVSIKKLCFGASLATDGSESV